MKIRLLRFDVFSTTYTANFRHIPILELPIQSSSHLVNSSSSDAKPGTLDAFPLDKFIRIMEDLKTDVKQRILGGSTSTYQFSYFLTVVSF